MDLSHLRHPLTWLMHSNFVIKLSNKYYRYLKFQQFVNLFFTIYTFMYARSYIILLLFFKKQVKGGNKKLFPVLTHTRDILQRWHSHLIPVIIIIYWCDHQIIYKFKFILIMLFEMSLHLNEWWLIYKAFIYDEWLL